VPIAGLPGLGIRSPAGIGPWRLALLAAGLLAGLFRLPHGHSRLAPGLLHLLDEGLDLLDDLLLLALRVLAGVGLAEALLHVAHLLDDVGERPASLPLLLVLPALLVLLLNGFWIALMLGLLSARFRDIPLVVASVVQVLFFITPIIWKPDMLPGRAPMLDLNPFHHLIEILRAPLLGQVPTLENWVAVVVITFVGWAVALWFFSAYRWRLAYWV